MNPMKSLLPSWLLATLLFSGYALASYEDGGEAYLQKNYSLALAAWSDAADASDPRALFALGVMHFRGVGVSQDQTRGVDFYERSAELGFRSAQFNLGLAYYTGSGVSENPEMSAMWWEKAATQHHTVAQYNLAALLWSGDGVPQNQAKAMHWFRKAKQNGSRDASDFLLTLYAPMYKELDAESLDLAARSTPDKKIPLVDELGMYVLGHQAMELQKYGQAFGYWAPLAEDGHVPSQYQIAKLYEFGLGVDQDFHKALDWYQKAAQKGQGDAQFRMGQYHISENPDRNEALGLYWIQSAADNNSAEAIEYMENY